LISQFGGAFNDNAWKLLVALLGIRQVEAVVGSGLDLGAASQTQTTLAFTAFTLPLLLTSLVAGLLADRLSKRTILVAMKAFEVVLMAAGTVALWITPDGGVLPLVVLGGMGIHSALFSPAKYGIVPELLPHEQLSTGNGLLELWSFLAILLGTVAGGLLLGVSGTSPWLAGLALLMVALIGLAAARTIPPVPAARTTGGLADTWRQAWAALAQDRVLRLAILGNVYFWTIASLVGQDLLVYAKTVLGLSDTWSGFPMAVLAVGIGLGSVLAGRWSGNHVEYGLLPLGTAGIAGTLILLGILAPQLIGTSILLVFLGLACGCVIVPIDALIQWRSPATHRGAIIAFANICVFAGVLSGSLAGGVFAQLGLSSATILLLAGLATVGATLWALWLVPEACLRFVLVLATHTVYRLRIIGVDHVPQTGGALLVPNHISFVDGFLLLASLDRPIRFLVDLEYVDKPLFTPLMRLMGVIPISSRGGPRIVLKALREAGQALDQGELVCVFPEGQITRTGALLPFRRGFERIVKGREVPIVPVHLDRVWGSVFSFVKGRFLTKWPTQIPYPVTVSFGTPRPSDTPATELRRAVQELGEAAWLLRKPTRPPLHVSFVRAMRRHPGHLALADATRPKVTCFQSLIGTIALARALRPHWEGQPTVGLLLPPSVGGALVNLAATLAGRTVVNLNYTVGRTGLESAARQAGLQTVVTSRRFVEKAKLEVPDGVRLIWLEDVASTISPAQKAVALGLAALAPMRLLERVCGQMRRTTIDDLGTIIFSSGSTGEPKGVMLSHFSLDSNVEAVTQILHIETGDCALGILPFFHSFGYLLFWYAVTHDLAVVFHPSPLDVGAIGELVAKYRVTLLVTTPTFLQLYTRRCTPEQFSTLRIVITGAEKLPLRLAQAFEGRFGIHPVEGYGITECSPVIAVNVPDFRASGFYQPMSRRGTVGQPLPGVSVRVVDPDTFALLPSGTPGMLLVKGANVMTGYLGRADLTASVMHEGWYITGDIATLDDDGFITITDRLSRFSKIGGEMVPHGKVEDALHQAAGVDTQVFAVTGIPDEKKGEQLAVLHTLEEAAIRDVLTKLPDTGLPNLFIPSKDRFVKVDSLPILGTGKLDLRAIKRIALERLIGC
jgi:acyl-[acyl-carrier-protein]-phospholipid O-acyltransferase/long-chain-fatty-acid--[acyl-carrier-protein] ligase